jgi:hypothetical protein
LSKAKNIGTRAETAVRNYLLSAGYDPLEAHRNVLKGSLDEGDVWLRESYGLIIFELKGGKSAKDASYNQILKWIEETNNEVANAKARMGFLVTQRAGVGYPRAGEWWAYADLADLVFLRTYSDAVPRGTIVRVLLNDLVGLIRSHG